MHYYDLNACLWFVLILHALKSSSFLITVCKYSFVILQRLLVSKYSNYYSFAHIHLRTSKDCLKHLICTRMDKRMDLCRSDVMWWILSVSDVGWKRSRVSGPVGGLSGDGSSSVSLLHQLVSQHLPDRQAVWRQILSGDVQTGAADRLQVHENIILISFRWLQNHLCMLHFP